MKRFFVFAGGFLFFASFLVSGTTWAEDPAGEIAALKQKVSEQAAVIQNQQSVIQQVLARVSELEARVQTSPAVPQSIPARVDLTPAEELQPLSVEGEADNVLGRPWFRNIRLNGFGAAGFVWTGGDAAKEHGGFINYEATVNIDAEVWEDIQYFHEIQTIRMGDESEKFIRTAEVYVNFKDLFHTFFGLDGIGIGAKIGRMDIPFGEDYLTQDVVDNPLVTLSAAYPYGFDEGIVFYGKLKGLNWVGALMDGTDARATEDDSGKFMSLKLYGNPVEPLYLSGSVFRNGRASKSAWEFGGAHFEPLGTGARSVLGPSRASAVEAYSYELDAQYNMGYDRYLKLQYGAALVDDSGNFDRTLHYFQVEPKWNLGPVFDNKMYLAGRFSAIGTFEDDEGYAFDGKPYANAKTTFGYDASEFYRWAVGLGYWLNPHTLLKAEYSRDKFRTINRSPADESGDRRDFLGALAALKFG